MADDERSGPGDPAAETHQGPSLELPSLSSALGFRRRRTGPLPPVVSEGVAGAAPPDPPVPMEHPEAQPDVAATSVLTADDTPPRARERRPPHLPGPLVAVLTGALVGLALVGLTSASLHLCSSMRGTSSCGRPGLLLLLVITAAAVALGSVLLRIAGVASSGSTSLLAVGLLVVIILLALLPVIFRWWMVIVVPLAAMLTYAAAWWVTTTYVEPGERVR
ncbi:MAG: hypothetical protein WB797_17565 [Nocardioides sp.]